MRPSHHAWIALLSLLMPLAAAAADPPPPAVPVIRVGEHSGFGRVVFDLPPGLQARADQAGTSLVVRFSAAVTPRPAGRVPRNATAIALAPGAATIALRPGVRFREMALADRLVIDLLDPAKTAAAAVPPPAPRVPSTRGLPVDRHSDPEAVAAAPPQAEPPPPAAPAPPVATVPPAPPWPAPPSPTPPVAAQEPVVPSDATPPPRDVERTDLPPPPARPQAAASLALAATPRVAPDGTPSLLLPFGPDSGAAAFRMGGSAMVVFDEARPIDLAALRDDPTFADARINLLPAATVLLLPLAPGKALRLSRERGGWRIAAGDAAAGGLDQIRPDSAEGRVHLAAADAGEVVSVPDTATGGVLLVGTQRRPGQAVTVPRRTPSFALRPSWQGVVVEPVADALTLRPVRDGFVIAGEGGALALAPQAADTIAQADAAAFSRRFDWPPLPLDALRRRMRNAVAAAAATPAQGRLSRRVEAAQAMLALGLGAEAQALLRVAAEDAPNQADDPDLIALSAIAALLAGRTEEAAGIDDPRLAGTDEIALWRAVRAASRDQTSAPAASVFAGELPLLRAYPAPLRDRLLPLALQTMALGGAAPAIARLLPGPQGDPAVELARAFALDAAARAGNGAAAGAGADPALALAAYDRLADGPDRRVRARAATRATELRLVTGALTPAQAADALERRLFAWRGDAEEIALRLRIAELRRQAGAWRPAIAMLREIEQAWPDQRPAIRARLAETFADALAQDAARPMAPLDLVAVVEENADLLADEAAARKLAPLLADRLAALDLPKRAAPVLEKLLAATSVPLARAELGARIAELRQRDGDATAAAAAIRGTDSPDIPAELRERRGLALARAMAAQGDPAAAAATLADFDSAAADELAATLLERAKSWPAALAALKRYAARAVPERGTLDERQARIVLRLATAAAQAGDEASLAALRTGAAARVPAGRIADMLALLTGQPVRDVADLAGLAREAALTRALPESLRALSAPVARPLAAR